MKWREKAQDDNLQILTYLRHLSVIVVIKIPQGFEGG